MSPIQTALPTAKRPSCTRRTSASTRRGFLLLSNRVGVTVDTCVCLLASMNNVHHKNKDSTDHVRSSSHTQSTTTHGFLICLFYALFAAVVCCCVVALPSTECYCWAVAYVQVNVPCYIWVTCYMLQITPSPFILSLSPTKSG